jgi:DNA-binding transcriptional MerR regulator
MSNEMLKGMITEEELSKLLRLKPTELRYLRAEKGMPFVRLSKTRRVYLEDDLMEWFKKNRVTQKPEESE